MLSRVASSIYWMSRYVERAENLARFIDVTMNVILDQPLGSGEQWEPLVRTTGDEAYFAKKYKEFTSANVRQFLTPVFDLRCRVSQLDPHVGHVRSRKCPHRARSDFFRIVGRTQHVLLVGEGCRSEGAIVGD
jgi:hypothetical protein